MHERRRLRKSARQPQLRPRFLAGRCILLLPKSYLGKLIYRLDAGERS